MDEHLDGVRGGRLTNVCSRRLNLARRSSRSSSVTRRLPAEGVLLRSLAADLPVRGATWKLNSVCVPSSLAECGPCPDCPATEAPASQHYVISWARLLWPLML